MRWRAPRRDQVGEPTDVLVVCTGNLCRSPLAERLLRAELPELRITSAGTAAVTGAAAHPLVEEVLALRGLSGQGHVARPLTAGLVRGARLVLTATREHRTRAVSLVPEAADRAFTLKELQRLLIDVPLSSGACVPSEGRLDAVVEAAARALRADHAVDADDDLSDPIGMPVEAFERCAIDIAAALAPLVAALRRT